MFRRLVPLLALAILAGSPAGSALAAPSCTADISPLRYRPHYTVSCAGQTIDTVQLVKTSNGASVGIATNGLTMRWSDTLYIYNLSTKAAQTNGGTALAGGEYRVTVSDPRFFTNPFAEFFLKK